MKRCLKCNSFNVSSEWICGDCGSSPKFLNNLPIFAEELSGANESYDPSWYNELVTLEKNNFWFNARNKALCWLAQKYLPVKVNYFELGCGSGYVLQGLNKTFPEWTIRASEVQIDGLKFAQSRVNSKVSLMQLDGSNIPFRNEFDVIGAYDVIEHIENDTKVLQEMYMALKPNGYIFLSVPQHMFLWSQFDEIGCHFRRYSYPGLKQKLNTAGFKIVDSTSFNSLLLPVMLLSRLGKKSKDKTKSTDVMQEMRISKTVNAILSLVLSLELALVKMGIRWPFGGSRIVLAKKI